MLASIHPLGERARHNRWSSTVAFYVAGSAVGGATAGGVMGLCGRLAGAPVRSLAEWGWPVLAAVSVAMAVDEMWPGRRLAGLPRQVNEDWLQRYRGWVYGSGFGFQLGTGVLTVVTTAMIYVWLFLALLTRSPVGGLVLGGCFGMVRAAPSLALGGTHRADDLRHFHRRVQRLAEPTRRYSTLALVAVVLALATRR